MKLEDEIFVPIYKVNKKTGFYQKELQLLKQN